MKQIGIQIGPENKLLNRIKLLMRDCLHFVHQIHSLFCPLDIAFHQSWHSHINYGHFLVRF